MIRSRFVVRHQIAKADDRVADGLWIIIRTAVPSTTSTIRLLRTFLAFIAFVTYFPAYVACVALDGSPASLTDWTA